jgi:dihydrofolate reductase
MTVHYSIVAAMSKNRVIGRKGTLPWRMPADLRHFRQVTMGHPILMGRKNYEDIGRPLPGRMNIILTRQRYFRAEGCIVVHSPGEVEDHVSEDAEIMVIGGAEIYAQFLPRAGRMYLTLIHAEIDGDTFFPEFDRNQWEESDRQDYPADEHNPYPYSFIVLERRGVCQPRQGLARP